MSDEQQDQVTEEEDEQQENDDQEEQEDQDEQGSEQDDQQNSDEDQSGQQQQQQEQEQQSSKQNTARLPSFKETNASPEFKFASLLSEIASLGNSVDSFITTLPSRGGSSTHYRSSYSSYPRQDISSTIYNKPTFQLPQQSKVTIMKDQDCQVSMQPQIIIQPTIKQEQVKKQPYRISNQSSKFLAQLYQENKKLKRWQNTTNSMGAANSHSSGYGNSRDRFQRRQYQKGIFNVDDRNREIDQAMQALRLQEDYE